MHTWIRRQVPSLMSHYSLSICPPARLRNIHSFPTRRSSDLKKAKDRSHIVEGLIKAISILDELIQTIRSSKNKSNAKEKIISEYNFSDEQAEAILALQLYRLTNTEIGRASCRQRILNAG